MLKYCQFGSDNMFIDEVTIKVIAGAGGDGCTAFRREKYVEMGGPYGGNGGHGASIKFMVDTGLHTLIDLRYMKIIKGEKGSNGLGKNQNGKSAQDVIIKVPQGTVITDLDTNLVIADMKNTNDEVIVANGGRGGRGNTAFKTQNNPCPTFSENGEPGETKFLKLELKLLADVGLVGLPSVGKSTFLSKVSKAKPKIADYHFTTLNPNLGVVDLEDGKGFVIADIPGIIEGASEGVGLGFEFLRHIERTRVIVHIVDAAGTEGRDPVEDIRKINTELETYNPEMAKRPQVIAANKIDVLFDGEEAEEVQKIRDAFEPEGIKVFPISAVSGKGVKALLYEVRRMLDEIGDDPVVFEPEFIPEAPVLDEPYTVYKDEDGEYVVEGPRIERMLGYTNLESEKGFDFFQKFLKENGILKELEDLGIQDGDTVRMYGLSFDYYK